MKSKCEKIGLVVLMVTAILAISAFVASGTLVTTPPVEVWNITASGTYQGRAIATAGDCVYLAGLTDPGGASFDDAFLNKYNSTDGTLIWNVSWGGTGYDSGWGTATDDSMVYLAGTCPAGKFDSDAYLNKYDKDGNLIWNVTWSGTGNDEGNAIATAGDCVYLAGDRNVLPREGGYSSVFLNKYDKDGNLIWNITWGGTDFDASSAAVVTTGDYVYLAGDTIDKVFLNKYDKDGNLLWNISWGETTVWEFAYAIATGDSTVYLAGTTDLDAFLNKYDKDGTLIWNTTWVNTTGLATATGDNAVYLAGWSGNPFESPQAFLNKYDKDGTLIWNITRVNASGYATATGDNAVYLAGENNDGAFLVKFSEPTPTPTENETGECKTLWYFDDQSVKCQQKQFCGDYMYESLRTFETEEECKAAFETYLKEKGKVTSTPTPAPPGFEVGFAIAGLLAVAYLVLKRRK